MKNFLTAVVYLALSFSGIIANATNINPDIHKIDGVVYIPATDEHETYQSKSSSSNNKNIFLLSEENSQRSASDIKMHTNYIMFRPSDVVDRNTIQGYTPQDLYEIFGLPNDLNTTTPHGIVAIISVGHDDQLIENINTYSQKYNLPQMDDNSLYSEAVPAIKAANKVSDPILRGAQGELHLDVEMVHAMSPNAKIAVFFAADTNLINIDAAIKRAAEYIHNNGGGIVSISWGSDLGFNMNNKIKNIEQQFFPNFPDVAYIASSGDTGGFTSDPAWYSNVISAGGAYIPDKSDLTKARAWFEVVITNHDKSEEYIATTIYSAYKFLEQHPEMKGKIVGGNGGFVIGEDSPSYQNQLYTLFNGIFDNEQSIEYGEGQSELSQNRASPDISFDSAVLSGVSVYDHEDWYTKDIHNGWWHFGGTSVSAPALAGMINVAGPAFSLDPNKSYSEVILTNMYNHAYFDKTLNDNFTQVKLGKVHGTNNPIESDYFKPAMEGYNLATGLGLPKGYGCFL